MSNASYPALTDAKVLDLIYKLVRVLNAAGMFPGSPSPIAYASRPITDKIEGLIVFANKIFVKQPVERDVIILKTDGTVAAKQGATPVTVPGAATLAITICELLYRTDLGDPAGDWHATPSPAPAVTNTL